MPPRKSDSSKVATGDEGSVAGPGGGTGPSPSTAAKKEDGVNIEDLNLPKSIVTRLAKGVLPPNTQIQGNAVLALSKSATVFVSYLSTHANEYAQNANRKTVAPADVFKALEDLEFDFKDRLEAELAKFNEIQTEKRNTYRKRVAADKSSGAKSGSPAAEVGGGPDGTAVGTSTVAAAAAAAATAAAAAVGAASGSSGGDALDGEPAAKKLRMDADADGARDEGGDASDLLDEGDLGEEEAEEEDADADVDADEEDEEDEEEGPEEDVEEPPEEGLEEKGDGLDEALDNGEDSD